MTRIFLIGVALLATSCSEAPQYQEECRTSAAKSAKSVAAMEVLLEACLVEFPASKQPDGTYAYFEPTYEVWIQVDGPRLSQSDWAAIGKLKEELREDQELAEERNLDAADTASQAAAEAASAAAGAAEAAARAASDAAKNM